MATRDTIIEVIDRRTGHRARIRVPAKLLDDALSDNYNPQTGRPLPNVRASRDHICIQAKQALAKKGRRQSYLAWDDIADSVRSSDRIAPRGSQPQASKEPPPAHGQLSFEANQLAFF